MSEMPIGSKALGSSWRVFRWLNYRSLSSSPRVASIVYITTSCRVFVCVFLPWRSLRPSVRQRCGMAFGCDFFCCVCVVCMQKKNKKVSSVSTSSEGRDRARSGERSPWKWDRIEYSLEPDDARKPVGKRGGSIGTSESMAACRFTTASAGRGESLCRGRHHIHSGHYNVTRKPLL